jgi:hypothetical protein
MDEGRKRVLGIMAAILAARKLSAFEGPLNSPLLASTIHNAISNAEKILTRIDEMFRTR